jgi:hypothetical protein
MSEFKDSEENGTGNSNGNNNVSFNNNTSTAPAPATTNAVAKVRAPPPSMTVRARRRREEAVRRLVADVQSRTDKKLEGDMAADPETHDWLVASTVASALEKGLDRDLHAELVQEAKDNAGRIGQVCHDHADVFLASVAQVAALGEPAAELADGLKEAQNELTTHTAGPMHEAAMTWEQASQSYSRARTLQVMVHACQRVAIQLERARKQAAGGRPRAALDAVDQARTALTAPMESLFYGSKSDQALWKQVTQNQNGGNSNGGNGNRGGGNEHSQTKIDAKKLTSLEQTPFGKRAIVLLPKIENEVLMSARRGLNRWFGILRTGGDGLKVGRAALSRCAYSISVGPGQLGLGGLMPQSYIWRAKTADNLIARVDQNGKVARAVRQGYWFDRDAPREADRLEAMSRPGMERRAEHFAAAFGWYRCWEESSTLVVDPIEFMVEGSAGISGSRHGLGGSRHGLGSSRHSLKGSRHGKGRSLGFRSTTSSKSQAFQEISSNLTGATGAKSKTSKWSELLTPPILLENSPTM